MWHCLRVCGKTVLPHTVCEYTWSYAGNKNLNHPKPLGLFASIAKNRDENNSFQVGVTGDIVCIKTKQGFTEHEIMS